MAEDRTDRAEVGELRHSSCGNVYRLERIDGQWRHVRRISNGTGQAPWDADTTWKWHSCQWEGQLPLVGGDTSGYPAFGIFGLLNND